MRRAGNLIERVADRDNLRFAWLKAIRGKRCKSYVKRFAERLDAALASVANDLATGSYRWGGFRSFTIFDPKEREIRVAPFRDRVASHALMNVCEPVFDRVQFHSSCACRKGRGQTAALDLALRRARTSRYYLKEDVRKYFDSIDHEILKESLARLFKDRLVLKAFDDAIDRYEVQPGRGVPIGSLTSQFFANHYLNALDRFVYEELKIGRYVRYMDDFVLWSDSKEELANASRRLDEFAAERLRLTLKESQINRTRFGFPFLGFRVSSSGLSTTRRGRKRFRGILRRAEENLASGEWDDATAARHVESALAFVRLARSRNFLARATSELPSRDDL